MGTVLLNLSDLSARPLQHQIFIQVRALILSERLPPGTAIPSIRTLAREQQVSVITIQRAYHDLQREGLIRSRRGKGFFVNELSKNQRCHMAEKRATEAISTIIHEALAEGLHPGQIRSLVDRLLSWDSIASGK